MSPSARMACTMAGGDGSVSDFCLLTFLEDFCRGHARVMISTDLCCARLKPLELG